MQKSLIWWSFSVFCYHQKTIKKVAKQWSLDLQRCYTCSTLSKIFKKNYYITVFIPPSTKLIHSFFLLTDAESRGGGKQHCLHAESSNTCWGKVHSMHVLWVHSSMSLSLKSKESQAWLILHKLKYHYIRSISNTFFLIAMLQIFELILMPTEQYDTPMVAGIRNAVPTE